MDNVNVTFENNGFTRSYSIRTERGCTGLAYFVYGGSADILGGEFHSLDDALSGCRQDFESAVKGFDEATAEVIDDDEVEVDDDSDYYNDDMDGDAESALASAGWGTDEDYGCYGGEDW